LTYVPAAVVAIRRAGEGGACRLPVPRRRPLRPAPPTPLGMFVAVGIVFARLGRQKHPPKTSTKKNSEDVSVGASHRLYTLDSRGFRSGRRRQIGDLSRRNHVSRCCRRSAHPGHRLDELKFESFPRQIRARIYRTYGRTARFRAIGT
jgi:hypothetical protein